MDDVITRTGRAGGRGARRARRSAPDFGMLAALKRGIPHCEVMDPAHVEKIDDASMAILEEVGVVFRDDIALADWRTAGARVEGDRVYLERGLVRELIASIHYLLTVSMKSGAPMAGTPEISLMNFMIGQMARFYNVPWRTSNLLGGAKTFDAQAGYESATTMTAVLHAGANYIWHSAGWNEAGMHCSVAKFVVDAEMCAKGYRMAEGPRRDDFDAAMQAVRDVGPGGHYLGHPHTLENFERAFFMPKLFDNNSIEQWQAEGSVEITARVELREEAPAGIRGAEARRRRGRELARLHRPARARDTGRRRAEHRILMREG